MAASLGQAPTASPTGRGHEQAPACLTGRMAAASPKNATECIVCRIIDGDLAAQVVHRDETLIAFLDHRPVFPGHVLVAPIEHVPDLNALEPTLMQPLMSMAQRISLAQQAALDAEGSFVAINNIVSQSVPHLHVHVVPRRFKDGLRGFFWPRTKYAEGQDAETARLLREALSASGAIDDAV